MDSQCTPCLGWRLDTRPSAKEEALHVTLNNLPLSPANGTANSAHTHASDRSVSTPALSIDTGEAEDTVCARLTSLLSSGLSANRRFSYPPTSHTIASMPSQSLLTHSASTSAAPSSSSSAAVSGPLRTLSPALMSPCAASNFFQTLDRKRAFKPSYRAPTLALDAVHRVIASLSVHHPAASSLHSSSASGRTAALYAIDASNASVTPLGQALFASGSTTSVVLWQVGVAPSMLLCSVLRHDDDAEDELAGSRQWSEFFTVQQLLTERSLSVKGSEDASERSEVRVQVQSVQSWQLDEQSDRHTLRQYEHESGLLREAVSRAERRAAQPHPSMPSEEPTAKLSRAGSFRQREVGEVKC